MNGRRLHFVRISNCSWIVCIMYCMLRPEWIKLKWRHERTSVRQYYFNCFSFVYLFFSLVTQMELKRKTSTICLVNDDDYFLNKWPICEMEFGTPEHKLPKAIHFNSYFNAQHEAMHSGYLFQHKYEIRFIRWIIQILAILWIKRPADV